MLKHKTHWLCALSIGWLSISSALAAPPDLRDPGVIAGIDRTNTYNLGATGMRGWIWVDRNNKGDTGQMTDQSRQILVTHCVSPANAVLAVDDVILGAMVASSGTVPDFTSDCRKAFATAITDAEKTGAGTLRVKRWRTGVVTYENIAIPILGNYSATAPFSCPKSTLILDGVRNKMVSELLANPNYLNGGFSGSANALALLSGVKPGDPNYSEVQTRLQTFARSLASAGPENEGLTTWGNSYALIYLSEYYLITSDAQVVTGIQNFTLKLAQSQSIYGTYGHGAAAIRPDGSGRLCSTGYGPVNAAGGTAAIALVLGKKALVAAGQAIDAQIDAAIQRASSFFAFFVNKGGIPYGEHEPVITAHGSNSKDATPAVFFALQSGKATETEYFSRISVAGWIGREYGHTGQALGYYWSTLGALMGGQEAASEHLKKVRWHLDLSRRTDGSFTYDGQEQYGPGTTDDNTYLGPVNYGGMLPNAIYLLTYSLPLQRLYITGKNADPAYTLSSAKVASAVAAGSFRLDRTTKSISELFTAIGDYDPIVRHYASVELASRILSGADLTNLRNLLSSTDPNLRQSACETLGILQDSTALPTIVARLNDSDIWVRAKAAVAISTYASATASTHRDAMLTSFIANATDPDVIDWNDPLQMANGKLSNVIFGQGVGDGTAKNHIADYTISAPKQTLLYPALRAALKHPDSYMRTGATQFCKDKLPLADVQAVYPEAAKAAEYDTLADRMWSGSCRHDAITMMANLKITEGIPLALAMLESAPGFEWGEGHPRMGALNALATYGDAARYTLPTLKAYLNQWSPAAAEYSVLVSTIDAIENAITAPTREPGLCVANPQVVTTTGVKAITLSGASPRGAFSYINVTQPAHGTITGTAPNLTYTPTGGYTGPDHFTFQTTDTLTTSTVATVGIVVGSPGNGVKGDYFNNMDFTSPVLTRTDSQINFDWGTGSPDGSVGADTFSTRWSGVLLVPKTGNYKFSALTSDGVRLYVNGQLVIDRFVDQSTRWTDGTPIYLAAGQYAEIYLEYYENTGSAVAKLKWTGPDFAGPSGDFIPQAYLFDGSGISNRPVYAFPQNLTTHLNTAVPVSLSGSGGTLTYTVLTQPANGTLSGTAPYLTYTPNNNFSGNDSFTFLVNNGTKNSLPATVSINIQAGLLNSYTWASAISGNWNDAAKWTPGLPASTGQPTYALNFTTPGTYTATHNLNNGFQLNQLTTAAKVTIDGTQNVSFVGNGGTLPQLTQNGSDAVTINTPLVLQAMTTMGGTGSGDLILKGAISGSGGMVKNGPGILEIGQNNSYSGGTTINTGTLRMADQKDAALGTGPVTLNGGTLHMLRINATNPLTVHGGRLWPDGGWGGSWSGPVTLNGDLTVFVYPWDRVFLDGNISGSGGLIAEGNTGAYGSGNGVFITGTNTYTGKTSIAKGMWLHCSSPASLSNSPIEISGGAKIDLNFTGTRIVSSLTLDGAPMAAGIYGSTTSPATTQNDTYFVGNGTITVLPTVTSLALTGGTSPANAGVPLTFTATVTGNTPTGTVEFYSGTTLLGSNTLNGSFQASLATTQLAIGLNNITARYLGNSNNSPSISSTVVVEINNTAVAAPTSLNATPANPSINLNWTASSGASGYYVKRSTTSGGSYTILAMVTGTSWQDNTPSEGITYYYVVSALNAAGESANSNQASAVVGSPTVTTTTLTSSPVATGVYGSSVTFTATVTAANGSPTGTVTFRSGANVIGTGTLSGGIATLPISTLAAATHSITATYTGSHDPSTSSALTHQVTPKPISMSGVSASNKDYDGTTTATLSGGSLTGVIGGDTVTIVSGTGSFANANVGTWAVTASGYSLSGAQAANYTLSAQPTVPNATINARPIHITGTKTYDGTTAAPNGILTIANKVDGGNLSLVGNATLAGKDAGTQAIASSYATPIQVQNATGTTGSTAAASFNVNLTTVPTNGNTLIAVISTRGISVNSVSNITGGGVTWSRVSQGSNSSGTTTEIWYGPNVSSGNTDITITQATLISAATVIEYSGLLIPTSTDQIANSSGTNVTAVTGTTSNTTQDKELWIGGISIADGRRTLNSPYGNAFTIIASPKSGNASTDSMIYALEKIVSATGAASSGGTVSTSDSWAGAIATFKTGNSLSLSGSAAANYTLTGMTSSVTVNPKPLMVSGLSAANKTYDGTTAASVTGTAALLSTQAPGNGTTADGKPYTGDTISLSGTPTGGSFATKHVGTAKPVTGVTGLTLGGAQAGNYTLVPLSTLTANITQRAITVTAVTETKTYDGTTTASNTPTLTPDLASGDTTTALSQTYQNKSAGTSNKTLVPAITINDGNGGNNYAVTLTNFTTGTITQKSITVAAVNATKTYDGNTTAPGTPTITPGLASGDTTSVLSQSFQTSTAGINNKVIVPAIAISDGNSGNNYLVTPVNFTTGTINKATATVTLGNLSQTFTNTPKSVSVTTDPPGLANAVTYNGSTSEPVNAGTYAVVATVNDTNYAGSATDNLIISYEVIYNENGNTSGSIPSNQAKLKDVSLTLATNSGNLAKTGFTFVGWNTSTDGTGTDYAAGGTYSGNASITLYAKWASGTNGTWLPTTAGPFNWGDSANWLDGTIANGAEVTAFFTPDIAAAQVINLESPRTIGNITFTDSTTNNNNLTISGANVLTLARSPSLPVIDVTQSARALTITSVIDGTNGLQKSGPGTLLLDAISPNFTGNLIINVGTLRVGNNNTSARLGAATYTGNVSNNGTLWFTHNQNQEFSGTISGTGTLNKGGSGTLTLSGANTYTGKTIIEGSGAGGPSVSVSSFNSVNGGTPTMASSSLGAPTTDINGTIQLGSGTNLRSCTLTYTGTGETTDRVISFGFNSSGSHTLAASGSGLLKFTSAMTGNTIITQTGKLNLGGTGSGEITQALPALPSGGLSKNDSGIWTLGGANSYTGPTAITAGKLFINGNQTAATGDVSVSLGATLGGIGTLGGNVTLAVGGKLEFNLSTASTSHDPLNINAGKGLTFSGASVLTITSTSGATPGTYTLITGSNNIVGVAPATVNLPAGWVATVSISGNSLLLNLTSTGHAYWVNGTFANGTLSDQNMASDPDGDGLATGVEWVLGGDPTLASDATGKKPVFDNASDANYLIYSFRRSDLALADTAKTSITVEYGSDLTGWTSAADGTVNVNNNADIEITENDNIPVAGVDKVDVKIKRTLALNGKLFARLKVVITP